MGLADEELILGQCMLVNADVDRCISAGLKPEHFAQAQTRHTYAAILTLHSELSEITVVSVVRVLRDQGRLDQVGGSPWVATLILQIDVSAHLDQYCRVVIDYWRARQLISIQQVSTAALYTPGPRRKPIQEHLEEQEALLWELTHDHRTQSYEALGAVAGRMLVGYADSIAAGKGGIDVTTGFGDIDSVTTGHHPGDLVVVAARPGMGKTAFVCCSLIEITRPPAVKEGAVEELPDAVYFHTLEMPREQIAMRMVCSLASVEQTKLRLGTVSREEWARLLRAASELNRHPIFIDDKPAVTVEEIRSNVRKIKREIERGVIKAKRLVVAAIDYLQLMQGKQGVPREQEVSSCTRALKNIAKSEAITVIALAQLNRKVETRGGAADKAKRPELSDLRESGAIEQDADQVAFIYRAAYYDREANDEAEFIIAKQRNGPTCTVRLGFHDATTTFRTLAKGYEEWSGYGDAPPPAQYGFDEEEERYP